MEQTNTKTILVTGGNKGIGLEICRQLDALGHLVIMGSRDLDKGLVSAKTLSKNVLVHQLDITSEESVRTLFETVYTKYGKLDALINNAGIGENYLQHSSSALSLAKDALKKNLKGAWRLVKPIVPVLRKTGIVPKQQGAKDVPLQHVKLLMDTNLYGSWRMIQVFIPLLKKSSEARIINISSGMGALSSMTGMYPAYSLSKNSLNALTLMLSAELKPLGISVNAMCPGWVKTDMGGHDAPRNVSDGADTAVWLATQEFSETGKFFRDRKEIAW